MKKKETLIILGSLLVIILSVSVAYFTTKITSKNRKVTVISSELKMVFTSGTGTISGTEIKPGWSSGVNSFTVKNESNGIYKYNIIIKDLVNTFVTTGYLQYKITSADGGYNMSEFKDVPKSDAAKDEVLAYSVEIAKGKTHSYSVEFKYLNSETESQDEDMGKTLSGNLYIEKGTVDPHSPYIEGTLGWKIMDDNKTRLTRTDFDSTFTETNTGTLYKATESIASSTPKDVYYFAGNAKNNWVKFGKYQSDKVVYRGYSTATNSDYKDYLTMDACTSATSYNINCTEHIFWNKGNDIYWRIIRTNHDGSIRLLYSGTSPNTTEGYIGGSVFNSTHNDSMYVGYMYGTSGSQANNRLNTNDSTIKTFIDNWYSTNLSSYSKYISTEAVYCNDREVGSGTYSANGSTFDYAAYTRLSTNKTPTYNCAVKEDSFSSSTTGGGNGKLEYPIALMTVDELTYAGGKYYTNLTNLYAWYYLNSTGGSITGDIYWWSLSPRFWNESGSGVWHVYGFDHQGLLGDGYVDIKRGVRPAISLKTCTLWTSGNGAPETPYEISTTSGC